MPHIPGHFNQPTGGLPATLPPGGVTGGGVNQLTPLQQNINPEALRTDLPPGIAIFGEIARQRAAQGGQQFEDLVASGRFNENPLAQEFINRGLSTRGMQFLDGQVVPQTGLIGAETALEEGFGGAIEDILGGATTAREDITTGLGGAIEQFGGGRDLAVEALGAGQEAFDPFLQTGTQAQDVQAALSGALGPEAQAEAFRNFQESPGVQFLRERGEKGIESQAGRFGAFGGNFQKALSSFNQGLALQDLQRQTQQLGELGARGFGAAQGIAGLAQTEAGLESEFGRQAGLAELGAGTAQAGITERGAVNVANLRSTLARDLASGRTNAGNLIAQHIAATTEGLAAGQEALGSELTNLLGGGATVVANILQSSGLTAAQQNEALAIVLANLATTAGTNIADTALIAGQANALAAAGSSQAVSDAVTKMITALDLGGGTE